ncbi:zinc-dependent alcohol dehydrogenase family protein [Croceitalea rosinachiae]|uniref:Zinc-dependent alcohol dehydrogenase family protein n=1 Tax=Croceitalea rosinachiae TaxID=3075596 RepID=A0ABU3AAD3_9FLAO|nr:zinc-dependent alcohol dehydrogenase family protein [Croceitalea sp. F388]MDT0607146.1 zinc-dependent alcohol dehydrogenase family protein [Croceitalea sp. F388]
MRAAVFEKFQGNITIQNVPDPSPKKDGVVLKVTATGLCRSDWHGWMGHDADIKLPHVPGHELVGTIVSKGENVKKFKIGERVTVPFVCGCGNCEECKTNNQQVCNYQSQPGFTHWGSFAEFVALDYADINLVKLPNEISDITAATLGCRFITSYRAVVAQGKVTENQYVAIHGCGGVGLSAIMIAKSLGAKVIGIDINRDNLNLAKEFGAIATINATQVENVSKAVKEISNGGVHVSIDALGSSETCFNSIANLKKRGRHIQVGLVTGNHVNPKIPMDLVIANELEIVGSHGMQAHKYPEILNSIIDGRLQPDKLIKDTISLHTATTILPQMNEFKHHGVLIINSF